MKTRLQVLCFVLLSLFGCEDKKSQDSQQAAGGTSTSSGSDVTVTGSLSIDQLSSDVVSSDMSLANRDVTVVDSSGKSLGKASTGSDGSYAISVPGQLVTASTTSLRLGYFLDQAQLSLQSVLADTLNKDVIGINQNLDLTKGHFVNLGKTALQKITAIRGEATLDGARDHTGIVVYVPGTSYQARTDSSGQFLLTFIPEGSYKLRFEKDGYLPLEIAAVTVSTNETTKVDTQILKLSGGSSQFSVKQVGKEGVSAHLQVDFLINPGNADRFKAGLLADVDAMPYSATQEMYSYTFTEDGVYTLKFMFADADGLESSTIRSIIVDTHSPDASTLALADRSSANTSVTNELLVIALHANCLDIDKVAILAASVTAPKVSDFVWDCRTAASDSNANFSLPENGDFTYKMWAMDQVGNISENYATGTLHFDNTPPSALSFALADQTSGSSTGTDITTVNITVASCTDVDKVLFSETQVLPPQPNQFSETCRTTSNNYTYTFANNIEGTKTIYGWGIDQAGNVAQLSGTATITLDHTLPIASTFDVSDVTSSNTSYTNSLTITVDINNCTDTTHVLVNDTQSTKPTEGASGWVVCSTSGITTTLSNAEGLRTIYLWARDVGGNVSNTAETDTITVDLTAPNVNIITLALKDSSSNSTTLTNSTTINATASGTCNLDFSKVYFTESAVVTPSESDFTISCAANSATGSITFANATNEQKTVYAWVKDIAGNISSTSISAHIDLDTVAPTVPASFALYSSATGNAGITKISSVNFTIADNCPNGDLVLFGEDQSSAPTEGDSRWQSCALSGSVSNVVTASTGAHTIYLWKKDPAGNIAGSRNYSITYDATAPSTPVISSPVATWSTHYTQSASITVAGTAENDAVVSISGGTSTVTTTADGAGNYSTSVSLNANSYNTITVTATDAAGNNSNGAQIYVYQDTIAPTISNVQLLITGTTAKITWDTNEATQTVLLWGPTTSYGTTISSDDYSGTSYIYSHSVSLSSLTGNTAYYFKIVATDHAGNNAPANDYADVLKTYIEKSGSITSETWNATDTSYLITNNLTVTAGSTLTVGPGVRIKLAPNKRIVIQGELNARGNQSNPISVTPNAISPTYADFWDSIVFDTGSVSPVMSGDSWSDGNVLEYVNIERGGSNTANDYSLISIKTGVAIINCNIKYSYNANWSSFITALGGATVYILNSVFSGMPQS